MKINKLYDDVYEIEEFLTEQELADVYTIINNTPEQDWFDKEVKNENNTPDFWFGKNLYFKSPLTFFLMKNNYPINNIKQGFNPSLI
jgi:hypothetical protein